ncbi:MAG: hypothetical protein WC284_18790 [Candidimonas sp.]
MEDFLDKMDIYAFSGWIEGEVVDGPHVDRYWVEFTLKYPYRDMPDPAAAERLASYDVRIKYKKASELKPVLVVDQTDFRDNTKKPKMQRIPIWLVTLSIPRRFIDEIGDKFNIEDINLIDKLVNSTDEFGDDINLDDITGVS